MPLQHILLVVGAYALGSINSAIIVCRIMGITDPRTHGSCNPGATNVLRLGGKIPAAITLFGDMLKGLLPVAIAHIMDAEPSLLALVGCSAFLGHLYPLWFQFKGGKGVATALGVQIGLYWIIGGTIALLWLIMAKLLRISSVAALVSMTLAPLVIWLLWPAPELMIMQIFMTSMLFWRHRSNILNLYLGTEGRVLGTNTAED